MSTGLRLLPVDIFDEASGWGYSHTVLSFPSARVLRDPIEELKPERLPKGHNISSHVGARVPDGSSKGEPMYGRIGPTDAHDLAYTWLRARELAPILAKHFRTHPNTAFICALPADTYVILDWY